MIVAAYYLSCVSGAALAGFVTGSRAAALWGGIFWGFLYFRVHHIGHLQILSFQWIPAAVLCLLRFWQRPAARTALLFVVAFVAQALVSWYLAASLGLARLIGTWRPRWQAAATACACALFLVEVFPVSLPISASHEYRPSAPDRFIAQYQKTRSQPLVVLHRPIFYFREAYPTDEATYMTDSTWHWARILNGFSGGEPLGFMERMRTLNTLPAPAAVSLVRDLGVDVIAVHGPAAFAGNPLWDFFRGRTGPGSSGCPPTSSS